MLDLIGQSVRVGTNECRHCACSGRAGWGRTKRTRADIHQFAEVHGCDDGTGEIILVLALALIFIGPEKLPQIATALGKIVRQIRRAVDEIKDDLKNE